MNNNINQNKINKLNFKINNKIILIKNNIILN